MSGGVLPGYSVLMSVYAKEKPEFFQEAISSVLNQTLQPSQFVLVCDGPLTEALDSVIASFVSGEFAHLFRVVRIESNRGLGPALNIGLKECECKYVARMDSDDVCIANRCERQLSRMVEDDLEIISGTVIEFEGSTENVVSARKLPSTNEDIFQFAKKRNPFNHPAVMFDRDAVEAAGGYRDFYLLEDYYLWIRMLVAGCKAANLSEPVLYMRADEGMYDRRGGLKYLKSQIKLLDYMKSIGYITGREFFAMSVVRGLSSVLPSDVRRILYKAFVRTKVS